jgi:hypothetical protein
LKKVKTGWLIAICHARQLLMNFFNIYQNGIVVFADDITEERLSTWLVNINISKTFYTFTKVIFRIRLTTRIQRESFMIVCVQLFRIDCFTFFVRLFCFPLLIMAANNNLFLVPKLHLTKKLFFFFSSKTSCQNNPFPKRSFTSNYRLHSRCNYCWHGWRYFSLEKS